MGKDTQPYYIPNKISVETESETIFYEADWQRPKTLKMCYDNKGVEKQKLRSIVG